GVAWPAVRGVRRAFAAARRFLHGRMERREQRRRQRRHDERDRQDQSEGEGEVAQKLLEAFHGRVSSRAERGTWGHGRRADPPAQVPRSARNDEGAFHSSLILGSTTDRKSV